MKKLLIPLLLIACMLLAGCEPITPEEMAQRESEWQAFRESRTKKFEVTSVSKGLKTTSWGYGRTQTEVCYSFTYITEQGDSEVWHEFVHYEGGNTQVTYGDTDQLIMIEDGDTDYYLQLSPETEERLKGMV